MDKTTGPSGRPSRSSLHHHHQHQQQHHSKQHHQRHRSSSSSAAAAAGTGSSSSNAAALNYHQLKRACRERGVLFEDLDFPPTPRSLYANKKPSSSPIVPITWLRPHVIHTYTCDSNLDTIFFLSGNLISVDVARARAGAGALSS